MKLDKGVYPNSLEFSDAETAHKYAGATPPSAKDAEACIAGDIRAGGLVMTSAIYKVPENCTVIGCRATCNRDALTTREAINGGCIVDAVGVAKPVPQVTRTDKYTYEK